MLETLCLLVNFNPFHAENLGEHALDQVMPKNGSLRDFSSFGSQLNAASLQGDQTVSSQPLESRGDRRRCTESQCASSAGITALAFRLRLGNGLEIVLFGNGDHHDIHGTLYLTILYHHSILFVWQFVL